MSEEKKDPPNENPFEQIQKQLQDMFKSANIHVTPMGFQQPGTEAEEGGDDSSFAPEEEEKSPLLDDIRNFHLKPRDIKDDLDRYVIRQDEAKRAMAVAVCDHYNHLRRCLENPESADKPYLKQNVLLLGPTGVGKTHLLRTLARMIGVPFVKADATKFSETGYVGHDVEDMVRDLVRAANGDTELAQYGIIYIDEIDKIAGANSGGKDVSGRGVQTNLLKLMEETDVNLLSQTDMMGQMQAMMEMQRGGKAPPRTMSTRHILFIVSGAFTQLSELVQKRLSHHQIGFGQEPAEAEASTDWLRQAETQDFVKYGFEPEFIGRLPVRVAFQHLGVEELQQILEQAEDNILSKYIEDFEGYGIKLNFSEDALRNIAEKAAGENTGARGLMTVLERLLRDYKFELPSTVVKELTIDAETLKNPEQALTELLEKNKHARRGLYVQEAAEFAERFLEQYGIDLKFSDSAALQIAMMAEESGRTVHTVCERLFKDYPYGLKLILKHTGKSLFEVTEAMVKDPDGILSQLVVDSYRKKDKDNGEENESVS